MALVNPADEAILSALKRRGVRARGRHKTGEMNKLEREYADHLRLRMAAGEVAFFMFESVKFRLADNTYYTPDFFVMGAGGEIEFHEVKGLWQQKQGPARVGWQEDARVKIKVAASMFPFYFFAVSKSKRGTDWDFEEF